MSKRTIYLLSLIVVIFSLVSCTIKYLPVPAQHIVISDDFAVVKESDFTFAVENQYWIKNPQNLTDYFTTFYISVKNRTSEKLDIELGDVVLLDENGNQYDAVTINYIEQMLLPKQLEYLIINTIEDDDHVKTTAEETLREKQDRLEEWREAKQNLLTYSFHFGNILPNAKKSGFIFFPKLPAKNNKCKVVFRSREIEFIRSDVKQDS